MKNCHLYQGCRRRRRCRCICRIDACSGLSQDCHVLCLRDLLCCRLAPTLPQLVPRDAVQDEVPAIHRQPRQQPTVVRLPDHQDRQRHQLCRRRAPRVRDGGPITEMHQRQVRALLVRSNLAEGGNEVGVRFTLHQSPSGSATGSAA